MNKDYIQKLDHESQPGALNDWDIERLVTESQKLKPNEVYLEVGVDRGKSLSIVRRVSKAKVYGVDINRPPELHEWLETKPAVTFLQGDSSEIAKTFKETISLIFIDGDHSYLGCKKDIEAWFPKMKKGGVMLFHDYDQTSPGVIQAVDEFRKEHPKFDKIDDVRASMAKIQL